MDTKIEQQAAMDEALVSHAQRLRIIRSNFRLLSEIKSKESTLQLVYDVLRICPFFKAFLVIANVPEIYIQEFWVTATVHHHAIQFKMDNKKHIVNLESFRDMLHISIRMLTDVNINKLYQPWRSFAAIINKCLTEKSSGYDSLRLSQAQIMWGLYHKRNIDYAYLMWEDFVYQVEHKNHKKSNEMYYPWDDYMFSTIKLVFRHQNTQQFGALLPIEMTNEEIRNSNAYKEYYAIATGAAPPKPKASVRRTKTKASKAKSLSALSKVAMIEAQQLKLVTKRSMQQTHISHASGSGADEGTSSIPGADNEGKDGDDDEEDEGDDGKERDGDDDEDDDGEEGNGDEDLGLNIGGEEGHVKEEEKDELYRDVNINQERGIQATLEVEDSHTLTSVAPLPMTAPTMTPSTIATITTTSQAPILPTIVSSTVIQNLPNFDSLFHFDDRLRSLEANFSKAMQKNQFAGAVSAIPEIIQRYMDQQMNEAVKVAVQIQSDHLRDEAQRENDEFLKTVDENMQKIIKDQVKEQVKLQVSKILPRIKQTVNEQLKAEVLTRSYHSSKTSYAVAADLSKMELKKILIEKMEGNKSIQKSDKQRNLYKALPDRGSKRRIEGKKPESASAPTETATRIAGKLTQGPQSQQASASESTFTEEPMQTTCQMEEPSHLEFDTDHDWNKTVPAVHESIQPWISELTKQTDSRSSFNELMDTPLDFSNFQINRLKVDTLTPELIAGPTYELMKGSCKSLVKLEYHLEEVFKATTDQLDWVNPKGEQYPHNLLKRLPLIPNNRGYDKHALWGVSHWGRKRQQFYGFAINQESARDVYSKRRIIAVTKLKIIEWHSYKHLDWITRRVEDLQLGVESYQKKLNLTKPHSYRSDLKRKKAYTAYSNPRGFIYQNKNKRNRLMWIDELHKFNNGTLTDVRTDLDDRLKGIRMQYLPQSIWRKSDKDRAAAMIQAIDKRLKTRRIMRSLERFVGGRLYEGDFRMLQRTI
nr:hypothetical protein [Tanacetum cinerariifolium]